MDKMGQAFGDKKTVADAPDQWNPVLEARG